jgi:hypothetical protein
MGSAGLRHSNLMSYGLCLSVNSDNEGLLSARRHRAQWLNELLRARIEASATKG